MIRIPVCMRGEGKRESAWVQETLVETDGLKDLAGVLSSLVTIFLEDVPSPISTGFNTTSMTRLKLNLLLNPVTERKK
jgi:hypothetical protein